MRAVILGGGGFRVPLIHRALGASGLPVDELVLYDIDRARLHTIQRVLLQSDGPAVRATTDLSDALRDADLVFAALRVGGVDGRVRDERRALDLGVLGQETVGAGGLSAALRAVPVAAELAKAIRRHAPEAWVITMTNPAGVITEVMARELGDRVIGVCDSPAGLVRRALSVAGCAGRTANVDYVGLNHLGWLRALVIDDVDRLPQLLADEAALGSFEEGQLFGPRFLQALGALPNEYLYYFYYAREALAAVQNSDQTRGEHVRDRQRAFYAAADAEPLRAAALWREANLERNASYLTELRGTQERAQEDVDAGGYEGIAAALAVALTGGAAAQLILNVPNRGTVPGLAHDAVVEVPCTVGPWGATPLPIAPPTEHQLGLLSTVKACERTIIEAALTRSLPAAIRAYALHPLVGSVPAAGRLAQQAMADATPTGAAS